MPARPGAGAGHAALLLRWLLVLLRARHERAIRGAPGCLRPEWRVEGTLDRKSTRLNSSHLGISYAVFCLKKKKKKKKTQSIANTREDERKECTRRAKQHPL